METHLIYLAILIASLLGPLALSFDSKVAFYRKWKYVFKAMLLPAAIYILWDVYFTSKGVWSFNPECITGIKIYNLPIEEVLFFFVVPYCCIFIYECIRVYFRNLKRKRKDDTFLKVLAIVLIITGIVFYKKMYTSWTFILAGIFIIIIYANRKFFKHFDATSFIISYSIILIPFLIVNGYLTSIPVVLYNDNENLGLKISTIPFEDVFYGMLLVMMNVAIYEKLKSKRRTKSHPETSSRKLQA
ncbi:MAG: lycopene cyclase domain-containing protein [Chitinophagaceae bacterium]|nr:lycopene cyclase domain-containing protein [Chitinophagaceae bacterium]